MSFVDNLFRFLSCFARMPCKHSAKVNNNLKTTEIKQLQRNCLVTDNRMVICLKKKSMFANRHTYTTTKIHLWLKKHFKKKNVFFSIGWLNSRKWFVCVFVWWGEGGKGGKHEGSIIKNVNWLHKNELCMCFSVLPPPPCHGSTYQHGGGEHMN